MQKAPLVASNDPVREIFIDVPSVSTKQGKTFLTCHITLGDVEHDVFFCVDEEFGNYLCHERADAFLIGILNIAMRERCDILCQAPVTAELLHQLKSELIPALSKYDPALYATKITAVPDSTSISSAGKTGTGCSCGIDSLYAIKTLMDEGLFSPDFLTLNNVGAYGDSKKRYKDNVDNARKFADEYGLTLIVTDSNIAEVFPQNHLQTHLYSSSFAIFALRKLWKRYYYASSGADLEKYFGLTNNHLYDSAKYDLIALNAFSIPSLRICNQGMCASRFEKTAALLDYKPAHKYLNVCLRQGKGNCGHCSKCLRTLWSLDALNATDIFHEVFDIQTYKANHPQYIFELFWSHLRGIGMIDEAYSIMRRRLILKLKKEPLYIFRMIKLFIQFVSLKAYRKIKSILC